MTRCPLVAIVMLVVGVHSISSAQENWPQFRGPGARGIGESANLPLLWGPGTNIAWRTPIPGRGWSSPIVWGNRIFVTTAVSEGELEAPKKGLYFGGDRPDPTPHRQHWQVLALDWDSGHVVWTTEVAVAQPATPLHLKNTYASETPVTDGERVYAYFGAAGLFCLDMDGNRLWSKSFVPRKMAHGWGTAASPVLHRDKLFIVRDNEEESFVAAYDKRTGQELWRVARDEPSNWSTPFVWIHPGGAELVTTGAKQVRSYDLDGHLLWQLKGLSSITIPTPSAGDGLLYLAGGYVGDNVTPNKPVYAIRPGAKGDLTLPSGATQSQFIAWMQPNAAPYNPSPLVYDGRFYVLWDFGFLSCRNAASGQQVYDKQRFKSEGSVAFTASPWAYRERVFCLSEDGDTYVCSAGDNFSVERINSLGEMCMATPALARDSLVVRTISALYRIEEKPAARPRFQAGAGGAFEFDTGTLRGVLRPEGKSLGLKEVIHVPSGQRLDSSNGLLGHYRVFTRGVRYGGGAWDWPSQAALRSDGAVEVQWPPADNRPFDLRAIYRWSSADVIDVETTVLAKADLKGFEAFLASYFSGPFTNALVWTGSVGQGTDATSLNPVLKVNGDWQMFPRDPSAVDLINDGRWRFAPNPIEWSVRAAYTQPVAVRRDPQSGLATVLLTRRSDCFAIASPHQAEGHRSVYFSLFGRDVAAGHTLTAKAQLWITLNPNMDEVLRRVKQLEEGGDK